MNSHRPKKHNTVGPQMNSGEIQYKGLPNIETYAPERFEILVIIYIPVYTKCYNPIRRVSREATGQTISQVKQLTTHVPTCFRYQARNV